jgi:hypothetical protein
MSSLDSSSESGPKATRAAHAVPDRWAGQSRGQRSKVSAQSAHQSNGGV